MCSVLGTNPVKDMLHYWPFWWTYLQLLTNSIRLRFESDDDRPERGFLISVQPGQLFEYFFF